MPRIRLRNGDIALLGQLNQRPLELGNIPADSVERLESQGLVRTVLGSCRITQAGQLTFQRQSFTKVSQTMVERIKRRYPQFRAAKRDPD